MSGNQRKSRVQATGRFRIIGGQWRGRRMQFPDTGALRPTPDRVRETLFNWLSPIIDGARCLDLYAGSGALGLEALSRGAAECVFVERNSEALDAIRAHATELGSDDAIFVNADALSYLSRCGRDFDVIFLDPPFSDDPWAPLYQFIIDGNLLRTGGRIYLETPATEQELALPDGLELLRSKRAGRVGYHLATTRQESSTKENL